MNRSSLWLFASCLLLTGAAAAAAAPDLREVLARHAQALGGLERLRALKAVRSVGTISVGGMVGKARAYTAYPDRQRTELEIAFIRQTMVQDGATGWKMDQTGQVQELTGLELQRLQSETYVDSWRYLLDPSGGTVRFATDNPESTQYIRIDVQPAGGTPEQLWLDPATYLVRKKVSQSVSGAVIGYLSDYRDLGGVKMAYRTVEMLGNDALHAVTAVTDSAWAVEALPDTLWRRPRLMKRDWSLPEAVRSVSVPVEVSNHHVFMKVRVNASQPLDFLLDSGAGATVIEKARAAALGLKTKGDLGAQGVGGTASFSLSEVDSLLVGGATLRGQNVITMALPDVGGVLAHPLDGILGYDFLTRFVVSIDYAHQMVTLAEPESWTPPPGARAVPLELVHNVPVVRASCGGGLSGRFVVDTGNNGSLMLHGPFVREHQLLERPGKKLEVQSTGAGGSETNMITRMDSLTVGGLTVPRPLVTLSTATTGITGSSDLAGNIGGWILEKFTLTFDYPHQKLYLEPNAQLGEPMDLGKIGWQVMGPKGHLRVRFVPPGSPADEAGVKAGDLLLKLGGQDLGEVDSAALGHLVDKEPGTQVTFEIRRGEVVRQVTITLRDIL